MTLLERLQQIEKLSAELARLTEELYEEIDTAINDPSWLLPEDKTIKDDTKNISTKDTTGGQGKK